MKESKSSQNHGRDTQKAHIVNRFREYSHLSREAHLQIISRRVGVPDTDAGMPL